MSDNRVPLYYELFFGLSGNEKIYEGLRYVATMENRCSLLVRQMADIVLDEMEFFKELKESKFKLTIYRPPRLAFDSPQMISMEQTTYHHVDPLLQELAKAVLKEIKFNQGQRRWMQWLLYIVLFMCLMGLLAVAGILIWTFA